jgi:hypothetical protein
MCKDDIPTLSNLTLTFENISKLALEVGFDACGVAPVHRLDDDAQFMDNWIALGLHGKLSIDWMMMHSLWTIGLRWVCTVRWITSLAIATNDMILPC